MKTIESFTIKEIESMSPAFIETIAEEHLNIKGHDVYLVDFKGYFGYSAVVCADGHHICYANDYELHHRTMKSHEELRNWYIKTLGYKLFTEDELAQVSENFEETKRKRHYLANYYSMRRSHVSAFGNKPDWFEDEKPNMVFSSISYAYYWDREFVKHMDELWEAIEASNDPLRSYETAKDAFKNEMWNHEYPINWQGNWDVISCFGNVAYDHRNDDLDLDYYFNQLGWDEEIRRAYRDARDEVMAEDARRDY